MGDYLPACVGLQYMQMHVTYTWVHAAQECMSVCKYMCTQIHLSSYKWLYLCEYAYEFPLEYVCTYMRPVWKNPTIVNIMKVVYATVLEPGNQGEWTGMCMHDQ